jgi:hypothetical protein
MTAAPPPWRPLTARFVLARLDKRMSSPAKQGPGRITPEAMTDAMYWYEVPKLVQKSANAKLEESGSSRSAIG